MEQEARERSSQSSPQLLERTFMVLSMFTTARPEWTTTELARACNVPVPTVHRIMAALHQHGFVARDELTKRFRLGRAAVELGRSAQVSNDLRSVSLPVLQHLAVQTQETVLLTVLNEARDRSVCIERIESTQPLRLSVEPGRHLPLNAGASQKMLLAFMSGEERERVICGPLEKLCAGTIDDPQSLREEVNLIRERGWCSSLEETNVGACGVAVALLNQTNHIVAAIGVAGPSARMPALQIKRWLGALQASAEKLSSRLALGTSVQYAASERLQRKNLTMAKG